MAVVYLFDIQLDQSQADQEILFPMEDASNVRLTGLTLGSISVEVLMPGAVGWGAVDGTVDREITSGNGYYAFIPAVADIDILGSNIFRFKDATSIYTEAFVNVVRYVEDKNVTTHPASSDTAIPA